MTACHMDSGVRELLLGHRPAGAGPCANLASFAVLSLSLLEHGEGGYTQPGSLQQLLEIGSSCGFFL